MQTNTKFFKIAGLTAVALVIVLGVIYIATFPREQAIQQLEENRPEETRGDILDKTRADVPEGVEVPEAGAILEDKSIAVPILVTGAAQGVEAQLRAFLITAEGGRFTPSQVIVNKNDTVRIDFTAKDRKYDITIPNYGLRQTAEKGETRVLEFRAEQAGKFTYFCELCGGIDSEAKGFIIVVP